MKTVVPAKPVMISPLPGPRCQRRFRHKPHIDTLRHSIGITHGLGYIDAGNSQISVSFIHLSLVSWFISSSIIGLADENRMAYPIPSTVLPPILLELMPITCPLISREGAAGVTGVNRCIGLNQRIAGSCFTNLQRTVQGADHACCYRLSIAKGIP